MAISVFTESTPNPASLKFITDRMLSEESMDFPDASDTTLSPLVAELFGFSFVKSVFISQNFITITKSEGVDWDDISEILITFIRSSIDSGTVVKIELGGKETPAAYEGSEIEIKIQQILDNYVKPAVEQDGGAIHYRSFLDGVVSVQLKGSCSGCPSSELTLKSGIQNLLTRLVPEVKEVISIAV